MTQNEDNTNINKPEEDNDIYPYKIILLGDSSVGKTSIIVRFCDDEYSGQGTATVGIDSKTKYLKRNGKKIELTIWDTAGQERFRSIAKNFYKSVDGILLVFDKSQKKTFNNIKKWYNELKQSVDIEQVAIIIVGNKSDIEDAEVDLETANNFTSQYKIEYFETSAKLNTNIDETFGTLIDEMMKKDNENKRKIKRGRAKLDRINSDEVSEVAVKKGCCK